MAKKHLFPWLILLIFLIFPALVWASDFKMRDGSLIKGELKEESIKVKATLGVGEVNLNPKDIVSITGGEKVEIRLRDGSLIKGEIVGDALKVKTTFGDLSLDPKLLSRYEGAPAAAEPTPGAKPAPAAEKAKEEEEVAAGEALETKTYDLPFDTLWRGVIAAINGMGEKTDKALRDSGQINTKFREYTDSTTLGAGGYKAGQIEYSLQVSVISLAEGKTKVALAASFKKAKMKVLSEETTFPEGLKYLRQAFYANLEKVITP
jgi:hypothetical protein